MTKWNREIVLFHAGQSLIEQVTEWACHRDDVSLQLASSCPATTLRALLGGSAAAVIDATERPHAAMQTLQLALMDPNCDPIRLGIYTEQVHEGLESFARLRGVLLLLGPMPSEEWDGFLNAPARTRPRGLAQSSSAGTKQDEQISGLRLLSSGDRTDRRLPEG